VFSFEGNWYSVVPSGKPDMKIGIQSCYCTVSVDGLVVRDPLKLSRQNSGIME